MAESILIQKSEMVRTDSLKFDGENPNRMTHAQYEALKINIRTHGFTTPVIIDQDNVISDGEHRVKIALEFGIPEIPAIRLNLTLADRKILRQVMNKVHGNHDIGLDIEEYRRILQFVSPEILAEMLGQPVLEVSSYVGLAELPVKEKDVTNVKTEHSCPKCGYSW